MFVSLHPSLQLPSIVLLAETLLLTSPLTSVSQSASPQWLHQKNNNNVKKKTHTHNFIFRFTISPTCRCLFISFFFICSAFLSISASFSASHCGFPPAAFSPDWKLFLVSHTHEHADKQVPPHSAVALLGCKKEVFHNKSGNSGNNRNNWEEIQHLNTTRD